MAAVHIVHYTSVCHAQHLEFMAARSRCVLVSLFLSFYNITFQQINVGTIGKKNTPSFATSDKQYILDNDCIYWPLRL